MKAKLFVIAVLLCAPVFAGMFAGMDPPASLLVTRGGYQWAWASPCAPVAPSCDVNRPLQMHHGFFLPSEADWLASFSSLQDVYDAFHPGGQQLCAASYFSSPWDHCDSADLQNGFVWNLPAAWGAQSDANVDTFVVRSAGGPVGPVVPEPSTMLLLGGGLLLIGSRLRKR